jgi:hypothetical protein
MARRSSRLLFLISPTKTLDLEPLAAPLHALMTTRRFAGLTEALVADVQTLKKPQLKKVFKGVSDAITNLNHTRFKEWSTNDEKSAAYAFDGPAFKGLAFSTLTTADRAYAQEHFRILSGLYGVLRPLDGIKPYRLEMGSKLPLALDNAEEPSDSGTTTLYSYWGDRLANAVLADLDIESDDGSDATADALSSRLARALSQSSTHLDEWTIFYVVHVECVRVKVLNAINCMAKLHASFASFRRTNNERRYSFRFRPFCICLN